MFDYRIFYPRDRRRSSARNAPAARCVRAPSTASSGSAPTVARRRRTGAASHGPRRHRHLPRLRRRADDHPPPLPRVRHGPRRRVRSRPLRPPRPRAAAASSSPSCARKGNLKEMERELGISYPTVRGRVDALVRALGLSDDADAASPEFDDQALRRRSRSRPMRSTPKPRRPSAERSSSASRKQGDRRRRGRRGAARARSEAG